MKPNPRFPPLKLKAGNSFMSARTPFPPSNLATGPGSEGSERGGKAMAACALVFFLLLFCFHTLGHLSMRAAQIHARRLGYSALHQNPNRSDRKTSPHVSTPAPSFVRLSPFVPSIQRFVFVFFFVDFIYIEHFKTAPLTEVLRKQEIW